VIEMQALKISNKTFALIAKQAENKNAETS
jgi:hypothetical protein